jgi:hypothetical protein
MTPERERLAGTASSEVNRMSDLDDSLGPKSSKEKTCESGKNECGFEKVVRAAKDAIAKYFPNPSHRDEGITKGGAAEERPKP